MCTTLRIPEVGEVWTNKRHGYAVTIKLVENKEVYFSSEHGPCGKSLSYFVDYYLPPKPKLRELWQVQALINESPVYLTHSSFIDAKNCFANLPPYYKYPNIVHYREVVEE